MMQTGKEVSFSDKMRYQLSANDTYVKGDPVIINFTLMNLSNENLWVLTWYTPLEGLKGKIFRVTCDGKDVPYEGPMLKRGQPNKDDYIQIYPGSSVSKKVDLSAVYQIPACNEAFVEFKGRIYDYTTTMPSDLIPKSTEEHQTLKITGNSITFRVVNP
jgi:peptidyl-Lys metalloendopeptidase